MTTENLSLAEQQQQQAPTEQDGNANFRTLLSSEALTEVWESLLGRTSSQDYVIDGWTQLLTFN